MRAQTSNLGLGTVARSSISTLMLASRSLPQQPALESAARAHYMPTAFGLTVPAARYQPVVPLPETPS